MCIRDRDDEYHLTVLGVIRRPDGRFLITKRVMTKAWAPGWWEVSGGAAQAGEESEEDVYKRQHENAWLITEKQSGACIGYVTMDIPYPQLAIGEIGYVIGEKYQRKGYASEMCIRDRSDRGY